MGRKRGKTWSVEKINSFDIISFVQCCLSVYSNSLFSPIQLSLWLMLIQLLSLPICYCDAVVYNKCQATRLYQNESANLSILCLVPRHLYCLFSSQIRWIAIITEFGYISIDCCCFFFYVFFWVLSFLSLSDSAHSAVHHIDQGSHIFCSCCGWPKREILHFFFLANVCR